MNNRPIIPIFFSSDDNYLSFLGVAIRSLIENASPAYDYRIHILNSGLNETRLGSILEMQNDCVRIIPVNIKSVIEPIAERLNLRDYYTVSIYFRLFIASMFPQYRKALYLDADIAINGDISKLYEIPLGSKMVGAVSDDIVAGHRDFRRYSEDGLGIPYTRYFNSGVMLMNLELFREEQIEQKFLHLLETYHFDTICPDQDYLNLLCRGQVLYLDKGWNKMSIDKKYHGEPMLVHYNMFYKPWLYNRVAYGEYFWKYAAMTPFYWELWKMQREFGLKGRVGHLRANRELHRHALRICEDPRNFRRVLRTACLSPLSQSVLEVAYEA